MRWIENIFIDAQKKKRAGYVLPGFIISIQFSAYSLYLIKARNIERPYR